MDALFGDLATKGRGIPAALALIMDALCGGLPIDKARDWPERFFRGIRVGANLSKVAGQLAAWVLTDSTSGAIRFAKSKLTNPTSNQQIQEAERIAQLFSDDCVDPDKWKVALDLSRPALDAADQATYADTPDEATHVATAAVHAVMHGAFRAAFYAKGTAEQRAHAPRNALNGAVFAEYMAAGGPYSRESAYAWSQAVCIRIADKLLDLIAAANHTL